MAYTAGEVAKKLRLTKDRLRYYENKKSIRHILLKNWLLIKCFYS